MSDWRERAKCANDPLIQYEIKVLRYDRFHDGSKGQRSQVAKKYCPGCPVLEECLAEAMSTYSLDSKIQEQVQGVWGGTTDTQRTGRRRKTQKKILELQERWKEQFPDTSGPIAS